MVEWFRRSDVKIKTTERKNIAEGLWIKCPQCNEVIYNKILQENEFVCSSCNHHFRMGSEKYFKLLLDNNQYTELFENIVSNDPLIFKGKKDYKQQLEAAKNKTGLNEAVRVVLGKSNGFNVVLCVMDFSFIGGSMGSAVGEKISRGIETARKKQFPLVIISSSGGARMQEGAYSLMQLAKTSSKLAKFSSQNGLYIPILTDPTTGGITASFAMLGDLILAEPNALIGFAGARVIKQTIGEDLPEGFQRSEFLLKKGFLDHIVERKKMKTVLSEIFNFFGYKIDE